MTQVTTDIPSDPGQEVVVQAEPLRELMTKLIAAKGVARSDAQVAASRLLEADLRGVHSHGSRALPKYLKDFDRGNLNAAAQVSTLRETAAMALLDADNGIGHVASTRAMQLAIEKARTVGTGTVAVVNGQHYGAAAVYALMAIEAGMIGFTTTNTGYATVAAYGSRKPATANNAIAWGVPTREGPPFVLDMACAASSWGKIETTGLYGGLIPEGWALDADGNPTTDPKAAKVLVPAAGARGYGLAFLCSVLAGPLAGGKTPLHKRWKESPFEQTSEHFFYAIDIKQFVDEDSFYDELQSTIDEIRGLPPAEGFDRVRLPGELEHERALRWQTEGLPFHRSHVEKLAAVASEMQIEVPW